MRAWLFPLAAVLVAAVISLFVALTDDAGRPTASDRGRVLAACFDSHPVALDFQHGPTSAWYNVSCSDGSSHVIWVGR
jgi:16S rRNA C1402 (ribose-2'-O) methylase RsmI